MTKDFAGRAPSQRQLRVSEEIRHVLARMLSQNDLFIDGLRSSYIMVTEVKISPDLSYATVFMRGVGDVDTAQQATLLNTYKGLFRKQIGKEVRLRIVPQLIFKEDGSFEEAAHISDLLNNPIVRADIEKHRDEE